MTIRTWAQLNTWKTTVDAKVAQLEADVKMLRVVPSPMLPPMPIDTGGGVVSPPLPPMGLWPGEPVDFVPFIDTDFSLLPVDPASFDGWKISSSSSEVTLITDLTAPMSPSKKVIRFRYPVGFPDGSAPGTVFNTRLTNEVTTYFAGYCFKYSDPFPTMGTGTKIWYPAAPNDFFVAFFGPVGARKIRFGMQAGPTHGSTYWLEANGSNPTITLNTWWRHEILWRAPSGDAIADGILRWWLTPWNGVTWGVPLLCGNFTNISWAVPAPWQEWKFSPTWGGGNLPVDVEGSLYIDHARVSKPA